MIQRISTAIAVFSAAVVVHAQAPQTKTQAAPVGETVSAIEAVKPAAKRWTAKFFHGVYAYMAPANRGHFEAATTGDGYLGVAYKLNDRQSVEVRQNFLVNLTDPDQSDEYAMDDIAIKLADTGLFNIANLPAYNEVRVYIPTSEFSREVGKYEFRHTIALEQPITGKFALEYAANTRLYTYSENADGQRGMRFIAAVSPSYKLNDVLTGFSELGYDGRWHNTGDGVKLNGTMMDPTSSPVNIDYGYLDLGAKVTFNKHVNVRGYIEQVRNLRNTAAYRLFDENETAYNIELSASL